MCDTQNNFWKIEKETLNITVCATQNNFGKFEKENFKSKFICNVAS